MKDAIVISSRVRLARNFADMPFPERQNDVWAAEAVRRVSEAIASGPEGKRYNLLHLIDVPIVERLGLVERHLASPALLAKAENAALLVRDDECVSIMVGEEDHIRIQGILPGMSVGDAALLSDEVDGWVENAFTYAFDQEWGYLTSCPTNAGTGMRASVMLHLPALSMSGRMGDIMQAAAKIGLTVRGIYGEGTDALGHLFQLSNQVTLGRCEQDIRQGLEAAAQQVIGHERQMREMLQAKTGISLRDRLMRSLGVLLYAQRLDSKEFMTMWSDVLLGADLELNKLNRDELIKLLPKAQPGMLQRAAGKQLTADERDEARAEFIRKSLSDIITTE